MASARRNHGSRARVPGNLFRAMSALYLERVPTETREGLARKLADRLERKGVEYHPKTLRRQMLGQVNSVPPEVEAELRQLMMTKWNLIDQNTLEVFLADNGVHVSELERQPRYVPLARAARLAELWLYFNRGCSKRELARRLSADLPSRGVSMSFDSLLARLTGRGQVVRRELVDQLLAYLAPYGITTEAQAEAYEAGAGDEVRSSLEGRRLVDSTRFRRLCRFWQLRQREASTRRLASVLRGRLKERGVRIGVEHLQRAIGGKTSRVRLDVLRELQSLVSESIPENRTIEEELASVEWGGDRDVNLAWVHCAPIAELAKSWVAANPETSMRQLALRVADTVRDMGYKTSHNSIQPVLGGWKKKTRGYVYRAMLRQFPGRSDTIPPEHIIGGVPVFELEEMPTFDAYIQEVRRYLPHAKSPHFAELAAMRGETLYGIPADRVKERLAV